jgi:Lrp/AsnC family transcriptional regulator, leucine-responsive regulatory protein
MKIALDKKDLLILEALQKDARTPLSEIGRKVGLTQPAVTERVRRLEEAKVIEGYHARVNPAALGYGLQAFIRVSQHQHRPTEKWAEKKAEVLQCHVVTGDDCAVLRVLARDVKHLEQMIVELNQFGSTATSIVLSSAVDGRVLKAATVK